MGYALSVRRATPVLTDAVDLGNAFREVDTARDKLGHRWLLSQRRQHPDYAPAKR